MNWTCKLGHKSETVIQFPILVRLAILSSNKITKSPQPSHMSQYYYNVVYSILVFHFLKSSFVKLGKLTGVSIFRQQPLFYFLVYASIFMGVKKYIQNSEMKDKLKTKYYYTMSRKANTKNTHLPHSVGYCGIGLIYVCPR